MVDTIALLKKQISDLQRDCEKLKMACANLQEEKQEEKQDSPHTPLQIKEENKKEEIDTPSKMCSEKIRKGRHGKVFVKPTLEEVQGYLDKAGEARFTAAYFWTYYNSREWKMGCRTMRDWRKVLDNWVERENKKGVQRGKPQAAKPQQNVVKHNAYKPVDTTGAVSYEEYLRLKMKNEE